MPPLRMDHKIYLSTFDMCIQHLPRKNTKMWLYFQPKKFEGLGIIIVS